MVLGSLIVSAVAALGGMLRPKSVAGIVGAARCLWRLLTSPGAPTT